MTESPMITGSAICGALREKALRETAAEDEKVVRILGCPAIVKRGRIEMMALRARRAVLQAVRGTANTGVGDVKV